jgi:hypothetical protein
MLKRTVSGLECEVIGHDGLGPLGRDGSAGRNDGSGSTRAVRRQASSLTHGGGNGASSDCHAGPDEGVVPYEFRQDEYPAAAGYVFC